jgi:CHAD domain-containing protein
LRRVEKANRQLVKNGRKISKKSPAIALHELRKEGKRLRYLLECFAPLFDEKALATILRPLRDVQDVLGEFQDTEVQANALLDLASELEGADDHYRTTWGSRRRSPCIVLKNFWSIRRSKSAASI